MSSFRTAAGGGITREEVILNIVVDIGKRLPRLFDLENISMEYPVRYEESMNTVLVQEAGRYQKLLIEVTKSLGELQKALKGLVVLSSELEAMAENIFTQKVPKMWEAKAYPSLKPLDSWVRFATLHNVLLSLLGGGVLRATQFYSSLG